MGHRQLVTVLAVVLIAVSSCSEDGPDAAVVATDQESETPVVRPGRANWSTGYFQAAVYAALLEELGYDVTDPAVHEYPPAEAYIAMAEGNFDFWPNGWYSQHYTHYDQPLDDGTTVGDHLLVVGRQVPAAALEGLVITKSVAEEHAIESLDQINDDPDLVALFDTDGDGLAEMQGCQEDWTCDDIIDETIERNGWSNLEQIKAGYPGMAAVAHERVENGEPVIQYVWSPSGYLTRLVPGENVLWLSLGDHDHVIDGSTEGGFDFSYADAAPFGDRCSGEPCWIGWEVADIQVTANADFAESNPVATALFEVVELTIDDIAAENVRYDAGENTEEDVRRHATEWIADHRPLVDDWLAAARSAG